MKLRMALEEDQFHLKMKDASKRYQFRMNDAEKIEVTGGGGASAVHIVTVTSDSSPAAVNTEYSVIATWLINRETVVLYDPFTGIHAMLADTGADGIVGDGFASVLLKQRGILDGAWCAQHCLFGMHLLEEYLIGVRRYT